MQEASTTALANGVQLFMRFCIMIVLLSIVITVFFAVGLALGRAFPLPRTEPTVVLEASFVPNHNDWIVLPIIPRPAPLSVLPPLSTPPAPILRRVALVAPPTRVQSPKRKSRPVVVSRNRDGWSTRFLY